MRHRRQFLLLALLGLLSACAPEERAAGPRYADRVPGTGVPVIRLAVHPLHNPQKLNETYGPLVDYLSRALGDTRVELEASNDYAHYEDKLRARAPELLLPNPYQTLTALEHGYRVLAEAGDSTDFRGIFIARRESPIARPADLRGRVVAYPAPTALAAAMMPRLWLARQGLRPDEDLENRYVGSQESAILNVHGGQAAVAATWPPPWRAFQREHPAEAAELRVIWETPPLINNAVMARDDLPPMLVGRVARLLLDMHEDPAGRRVLMGMETARFHAADDARYRQAMQTFLDDYQHWVGALP